MLTSLFSSFQLCHCSHQCWVRHDRNHPLGSPLISQNTGLKDHSFVPILRKELEYGRFPPSCTVLCRIGEGVWTQNTTGFQWSPFLVIHWPENSTFSTGLYSFHKGVLVHILLLTWCLHGATRAWNFLVYHLGDVSQIVFLQVLCYFTAVWTGCSLGPLVLL